MVARSEFLVVIASVVSPFDLEFVELFGALRLRHLNILQFILYDFPYLVELMGKGEESGLAFIIENTTVFQGEDASFSFVQLIEIVANLEPFKII